MHNIAFNRNDDKRNVNVNRNNNDWNDNWWFGGVRKSLQAPPALGGVSFCSCLLQPPSILPASPSGWLSAPNFWLSRALSSQAICTKYLRRSSFRLARSTTAAFCSLPEYVAVSVSSMSSMNS